MNFLIFCVDQMQSFHLGCNGNKQVKTPNLDKLAQEGTTFSRAYCANTVCMPSRASMFTGLTPKQHGLTTNGMKLNEDLPTIAETLHNNGYRTYGAGKFHIQQTHCDESVKSLESKVSWDKGEITKLPKGFYGFDETHFVGGHGFGCYGEYKNWLDANHPGAWEKYNPENSYHFTKTQASCWRMEIPSELHYNNWIADNTIDFINSVKEDEKFFVWCSFPDPHAPYTATKPYSDMYNPQELELNNTWDYKEESLEHLKTRRENYVFALKDNAETQLREMTAQTFGMITHIDDNIGRVLDVLKEKKLEEDTVIVFIADHGEYLGSHSFIQKADWPYEELARVPYIWKVPNGSKNGACDSVVSALDLVPTILDFAGISDDAFVTRGKLAKADRNTLPGRSLKEYLKDGNEIEEQPAFIEYDEDWFEGPFYRARTIVEGNYKLTLYVNAGDGLLFDLENDPYEKNNLYFDEKYKEIKIELTEKLLRHLVKTDRNDVERSCAF